MTLQTRNLFSQNNGSTHNYSTRTLNKKLLKMPRSGPQLVPQTRNLFSQNNKKHVFSKCWDKKFTQTVPQTRN